MTNDLNEALEYARRQAEDWKRRTPEDTPPGERFTVYVIEGCDCPNQGGLNYRYHIHHYTDAGFFSFHALHQDYNVVARFPA